MVVLRDGVLVAGDFIRLSEDSFGGKPLELDAEAAAFADGAFYVIGSHGRSRHPDGSSDPEDDAKAVSARRLFRIVVPLEEVRGAGRLSSPPDVTSSSALGAMMARHPDLAASYDSPLDQNGLTVEGLAVREGNILVGMRGPILADGSALVFSAPLSAVMGDAGGDGTVLRLNLARDRNGFPRGVRDLAVYDGRLLVLAGPQNDPLSGQVTKGDYAVISVGEDGATIDAIDLHGYGDKTKPEAIVPLGKAGGGTMVLVMFDGPKDGAPRSVALGEE